MVEMRDRHPYCLGGLGKNFTRIGIPLNRRPTILDQRAKTAALVS